MAGGRSRTAVRNVTICRVAFLYPSHAPPQLPTLCPWLCSPFHCLPRSCRDYGAPDLPLGPTAHVVLGHSGEIDSVFRAGAVRVIRAIPWWPVEQDGICQRGTKLVPLLMLRFDLRAQWAAKVAPDAAAAGFFSCHKASRKTILANQFRSKRLRGG